MRKGRKKSLPNQCIEHGTIIDVRPQPVLRRQKITTIKCAICGILRQVRRRHCSTCSDACRKALSRDKSARA
jgi:hypothetical protein